MESMRVVAFVLLQRHLKGSSGSGSWGSSGKKTLTESPLDAALVNREDMLRDANSFDSCAENIVIRWHIAWGSYAV